jgi:hypothetical protein
MEKEEKYITLIDDIEPLLAYKDRWVRKDSNGNIINEVFIKEKPQWLVAYVTEWRPADEYLTEEGHVYYREYIEREHLRIAAGYVEELSDFEDENSKPIPSVKPTVTRLTTADTLLSIRYLIRKAKRRNFCETGNDDKEMADAIRNVAEYYSSLIEQGKPILEDNTDSINEEIDSRFPFVLSDFRDSFNDSFSIPYKFSEDKSLIENISDFLYYYQKLGARAKYGRLRSLIKKAEKELKKFINKNIIIKEDE